MQTQGFFKGIYAYLRRRKECNKNYSLSMSENGVTLLCSNGKIYSENEINPIILKEFLIDKH
jgi:hypothetical protein